MSDEKICKQVEYYFSDANYARDRFMQETAAKNEGCVPVDVLLTFNRLKNLNATKEAIISAVKNSKIVSIEGEALKKVITESYTAYCKEKDLEKRVVCISGFPKDYTLEDIQQYLSAFYLPVRVSMKKDEKKEFNGICLVEYSSVEDAEKMLSTKMELLEVTGEVKRQKTSEPSVLSVMRKEDYIKAKKDEDNAKKDKKFIEKVKRDFLDKLYTYETEVDSLSIADIKAVIKDAAFVDLNSKVIRMKFQVDWREEEFSVKDKKFVMKKMTKEAAEEYVEKLEIKKVSKKNKK